MKVKKIIFLPILLILLGAGCEGSAPEQKTIASPVFGNEDAPVEIVEYFDYQCGACAMANEKIVRYIFEDYVESGQARFTYKNMAFMGAVSRDAANAALCAHEQGQFKEYHAKLFGAQGEEGKSDFSNKKLIEFASGLDIDIAQFESCIDSRDYQKQVLDEIDEAGEKGVSATPTFFINGEKIVGGGSYLSVKRIIDKKLEEISENTSQE